jgi:hypothetical protein
MTLVRVLPMVRGWVTADDLMVSSGVDLVAEHRIVDGADARTVGVFHAAEPWRAATDEQAEALVGLAQGWAAETVLVFAAPQELRARAAGLRRDGVDLVRMTGPARVAAEAALAPIASRWVHAKLYPAASVRTRIVGTRGSERSTTFDSVTGRYRGLHVDSWGSDCGGDHGSLRSGAKICVNVGDEPRWLVYVPRSMVAIRAELDGDASLAPALLVDRYLRAAPLPAVRIRIRPGQAYFAPVHRVIHDGLPGSATADDLNVQLLLAGGTMSGAMRRCCSRWQRHYEPVRP